MWNGNMSFLVSTLFTMIPLICIICSYFLLLWKYTRTRCIAGLKKLLNRTKEYYLTLNPAYRITLTFCLFLKTMHILHFSKSEIPSSLYKYAIFYVPLTFYISTLYYVDIYIFLLSNKEWKKKFNLYADIATVVKLHLSKKNNPLLKYSFWHIHVVS